MLRPSMSENVKKIGQGAGSTWNKPKPIITEASPAFADLFGPEEQTKELKKPSEPPQQEGTSKQEQQTSKSEGHGKPPLSPARKEEDIKK